MGDSTSFLEAFKGSLKDARKQRKSDELLDFIIGNWSLFCSSKACMDQVVEELVQYDDLSVTALAEALGIPSYVIFKKVKMVDTARVYLSRTKSPLYKLYKEQLEKRRTGITDPALCLFLVAGNHTLVMTNTDVLELQDSFNVHIPSQGHRTIHVFPYLEAPLKMPSVFNHKENYNE